MTDLENIRELVANNNSPGSKETAETGETREETKETTGCCSWRKFEGVSKAQGYAFAVAGNGSIPVSNVFLTTCFIYLASEEAGCVDEDGIVRVAANYCNGRIHGFFPTTLVTNVAVFAGILAALTLPVIGAIIDYTSHRRLVGRIVAFLMWMIQTIQIFTTQETWFSMLILQAIVVALFEIHYSLVVSYLPDIARYDVDHDTMINFNRLFFIIQYSCQATWMVTCLVVIKFMKFNSISGARLGQSISSLALLIFYSQAWRILPKMEGRRKLPEGKSLLLQGFRQNLKTLKALASSPNKTLKWFYLTVMFSEAGATSLMPVFVSFTSRVFDYGPLEVGLTFLLALVCALPGVMLNAYICRKFDPKVSLRLNFLYLFLVTLAAVFVLTEDNPSYLGFFWGSMWGFAVGWFYSGEILFYTFCIPASQETELAGFFVQCTVIMTWLPSLAYIAIVESGGDEQLGLGSLCIFQFLSMVTIAMVPEWKEVIEGSKKKLLFDHVETQS